MNDRILAQWLGLNLKNVKNRLGAQCTYLSFTVESGGRNAYKAKMKNDLGSKDEVVLYIGKPLETLTEDDFDNLYFKLNSREYEGRV